MPGMSTSTDPTAAESLDSWHQNATYWDDAVGADGNMYWSVLQEPTLAKLFAAHLPAAAPGARRALDLATGNGLCARWMARRGANVVATDGTDGMLDKARARWAEEQARAGSEAAASGDIEFAKLDVTEPADFEALIARLGGERFDVILINMAIMDVATLDPLAQALPRLLKEDGVFVGTMLHPVFFTPRTTRTAEIHDDHEIKGRNITYTYVLNAYLEVPPWKGYAILGQPRMQYYFHRSLHELFGVFFGAGLVLDGLEEPTFGKEHASPRVESMANFTQFPPILAMRFRLAK